MKSHNYFIAFCLLTSLSILGGCHDRPAHNANSQVTPITQPGQGAASPGKPQPPIRIEYQLSKDIQVGVPTVIHLSLTPMVDAKQVLLRYRAPTGIDSGDPQMTFTFGPTQAATPIQQDITVIPQSEGRFRIIISVMIASQHGGAGSRSMSIPLVVGNPPPVSLKPAGKISKDAQGQAIEVTPAQEQIIQH